MKHFVFIIWLKIYSSYNVFNEKDINTFDVLTFIQVSADKDKFIQTKNRQVKIYFDKCFLIYSTSTK